ncbi:hypothetical protein [Micromonospora sp. NPDC049282]|uniref:hypothetical protein n=1 Tax=Micromonospora sp. NPDC049282 TaxID=3364269 RepID=UPI003717F903
MTHPSRRHLADDLARRLAPYPVQIVPDPEPDGPRRTLRTATAAWSAVGPGCTHHLVLQDDAVVPAGFLAHAFRAVEAQPDAGVALHSDWGSRNGAAVRMAALLGAHWVRAVCDYVPTIALALPAAAAKGLTDYSAGLDPDEPDDIAVAHFAREVGLPVRLAVPNLTGHHDVPSVVGNDSRGRREASCYIGAPPDGWSFDPTRVLDGFDCLPYFKHGEPRIVVENDRPTNNWSPVPLATAVHRFGVNESDLREGYRRCVARPEPWLADLAARVPDDQLWALWVTACLMGLARSRVEPFRSAWERWGSRVEPAIRTRVLETLALGGMFPRLRHDEVARLGAAPARLAALGLAAGDSWDRG